MYILKFLFPHKCGRVGVNNSFQLVVNNSTGVWPRDTTEIINRMTSCGGVDVFYAPWNWPLGLARENTVGWQFHSCLPTWKLRTQTQLYRNAENVAPEVTCSYKPRSNFKGTPNQETLVGKSSLSWVREFAINIIRKNVLKYPNRHEQLFLALPELGVIVFYRKFKAP